MVALAIALGVGAYLVGSIPFGVVVARTRRVDLRAVGSGNIGATNAARALGPALGALVLMGDALKGFGPVLAVRLLLRHSSHVDSLAATAGLLCFLGHLFPVWQRFRGGKGVATALGVFLALSPLAALASAVVYGVVYALTRLSSAGSLAAVVTAGPLVWFCSGHNHAPREHPPAPRAPRVQGVTKSRARGRPGYRPRARSAASRPSRMRPASASHPAGSSPSSRSAKTTWRVAGSVQKRLKKGRPDTTATSP